MKYTKILSAVMSFVVAGGQIFLTQNVFTEKASVAMAEDNMLLCSLGDFTFSVADEYAMLIRCNENVSGKIILPSEILGVPLVRIKEEAFLNCNKIESIELGANVGYIGKNAFKGCTSLSSIKIWNKYCNIAGAGGTMGYPEKTVLIGRSNSIPEEYSGYYDYKFQYFENDIRGDVNNDQKVDAVDASNVLSYYSKYSTAKVAPGEYVMMVCDVNNDGKLDSVDASRILSYYTYASNSGNDDFVFYHDYNYDNDFQKFDGSQKLVN